MPGAVANDDANAGQLQVGESLQRVSVAASKFDAADHDLAMRDLVADRREPAHRCDFGGVIEHHRDVGLERVRGFASAVGTGCRQVEREDGRQRGEDQVPVVRLWLALINRLADRVFELLNLRAVIHGHSLISGSQVLLLSLRVAGFVDTALTRRTDCSVPHV